ncbi:something about silencing, SAS, complex subunit 4-domain-containing protein [Aspergillus crustosus]
MRRALVITATAITGFTIGTSLYLSYQKQSLAAKVTHRSARGQLSPSTPHNVSSLPPDICSSRYYTLYDYASVSTTRDALPDLTSSQLLTVLLRRNMRSFASSPQARLLKFIASGPETLQSFDPTHLATLDFNEGDLVCNAHRVKLRTGEKAEFEFQFGVQGRLVVSIEARESEVVFHNETLMWRENDSKSKLPLERGLPKWMHEYTAWWMLESGLLPFSRSSTNPMTPTAIMAVQSRSSLRVLRRDTNDNEDSVQPPPSKRLRLHPPPARRRKSSPDLLDTTIESAPPSTSTKLRRPRPLFTLPSAHTTSSPPPTGGIPRIKNLRLHHHDTQNSTSAAIYLNGGRESPDPLDTISPAPAPAPAPVSLKSAPKPPPNTSTPTSAAYRQRRVTQPAKPESKPTITERTTPKPARHFRGTTGPPPPQPILTLLAVPAGTADRAVPGNRRSLRSHDGGSRARSELALYFPNYEELMSLAPPKTELLSGSTVIKLVDDLTDPPASSSASVGFDADTPFGNPLVNLHKCEVIALPDLPEPSGLPKYEPELESKNKNEDEENVDPLNEEHYFKAHRRHERQEKQLRNIERDRAQHEKQQLDRLLDELKSQDWLRVMGITGRSLTEQDKKLYEPKRDYFIKEISALLQKFKIWKEEEKRRKLDKSDKSTSFHSDAADSSHHSRNQDKDDSENDVEASTSPLSTTNTDIDVDVLAARQLLQEARSATAGKRPKSLSKPDHELPAAPPEPEKPFTSFYAKPHLREQAMSGNRKGRTRLAFGQPIPDLEEKEFELPGDILTADAIKSCQRKRRRVKRASQG